MNILIIEPDVILARQYHKAFIAAGAEARTCSNAQEAVIAVDERLPDAIVLELQLAEHSGVEFLHEFRSYEDWTSIPVIILSAVPEYAIGSDSKMWNQFGVVRYFYKPKTSLQQLVGAVKTIVSERHNERNV